MTEFKTDIKVSIQNKKSKDKLNITQSKDQLNMTRVHTNSKVSI